MVRKIASLLTLTILVSSWTSLCINSSDEEPSCFNHIEGIEFSYEISECNKSLGWSTFVNQTIWLNKDTLYINGVININCNYEITNFGYDLNSTHITLLYVLNKIDPEFGNAACMCSYPFEAEFEGLVKRDYQFQISECEDD